MTSLDDLILKYNRILGNAEQAYNDLGKQEMVSINNVLYHAENSNIHKANYYAETIVFLKEQVIKDLEQLRNTINK